MTLSPRILWSHSRNVLACGYTSGIIYQMPLWLPAETPAFEYGVIRQDNQLLVYALDSRNKINMLLQESKNEFIHKPAPQLLLKSQGRDKAEGTRDKALA